MDERDIDIPAYIKNDGYVLEVFADKRQEIIVAAKSPSGVFYGVQTLLQLINKKAGES